MESWGKHSGGDYESELWDWIEPSLSPTFPKGRRCFFHACFCAAGHLANCSVCIVTQSIETEVKTFSREASSGMPKSCTTFASKSGTEERQLQSSKEVSSGS